MSTCLPLIGCKTNGGWVRWLWCVYYSWVHGVILHQKNGGGGCIKEKVIGFETATVTTPNTMKHKRKCNLLQGNNASWSQSHPGIWAAITKQMGLNHLQHMWRDLVKVVQTADVERYQGPVVLTYTHTQNVKLCMLIQKALYYLSCNIRIMTGWA